MDSSSDDGEAGEDEGTFVPAELLHEFVKFAIAYDPGNDAAYRASVIDMINAFFDS